MTRRIELGVIGLAGPVVIITENDDGSRDVDIPGMHLSEDCSEWLFNADIPEDNTAAGGTGVGSTKPD